MGLQSGFIFFHPFTLIFLACIFEMVFLIGSIRRMKFGEKFKDSNSLLNFTPNLFRLVFSIVAIYNLFFILGNDILRNTVFGNFPLAMISTAIIGVYYLIIIFSINLSNTTLILSLMIIIYEIICFIIIIPRYNHYLAVIWLYLPLCFILVDLFPYLKKKLTTKYHKSQFEVLLNPFIHLSLYLYFLVLLLNLYYGRNNLLL